jgi:hypothetical protein
LASNQQDSTKSKRNLFSTADRLLSMPLAAAQTGFATLNDQIIDRADRVVPHTGNTRNMDRGCMYPRISLSGGHDGKRTNASPRCLSAEARFMGKAKT